MASTEARDGALSIRVEPVGDAQMVRVFGGVDMASAEGLERELRRTLETATSGVLLDLSGVGFMDSTGLRTLLSFAKQSSIDGNQLRIVRPLPPLLERLFEVAGLTDHLPIAD